MAESLRDRFGPVALVTGASSGLGKAFARHLAREGFDLIVTARREPELAALAEELRAQYNIRCLVRALDLAEPKAVDTLLDSLGEEEIDLLVSNAGFGSKGRFEADSLETCIAMVNTNCVASLALCHHVLPGMKARQRGGVIITGSMEGEVAFPFSATYAASKAFLHSLGTALATECEGSGVDILLLAPGPTDTEAPRKQGFKNEQLSGLMAPEIVVAGALAQLGRRTYWMPGWQNRLMIRMLKWLPRQTAARMAGAGLRAALQKSGREL